MIIKRIDERLYDEYFDKTFEELEEQNNLQYMFDNIDSVSRTIKLNGETLDIQIDLKKYWEVEKKDLKQREKEILFSQYLYEDFNNIPANILLDKFVWAYLNIKIFSELIQKHYIDYRLHEIRNYSEERKHKEYLSLIERHFFSKGGKSRITRTGFRWLWYLPFKVDGEKKYIEATHRHLDPIRAMFERKYCNDKKALKAYIDFIIKYYDVDNKRLNDKQRSTVATHIFCVGAVSRFGTFEQDELAKVIENESKYIIN